MNIDLRTVRPIELMNLIQEEAEVTLPEEVETPEGIEAATKAMNRAIGFYAYFDECRIRARVMKRAAKRAGCTPEESDRLLGVEEVLEGSARKMDRIYTYVSRLFTIKQQQLEEKRMAGKA